MPKIWLNERGRELYPHLANEWLLVYGFNSDCKQFLVWDEIMYRWLYISIVFCEGRREGAVE